MLILLGLVALVGFGLGVVSLRMDASSKIPWFNGLHIVLLIGLLIILSLVNTIVQLLPTGILWPFTLGYIIGTVGIGMLIVVLDEWFEIKIRL